MIHFPFLECYQPFDFIHGFIHVLDLTRFHSKHVLKYIIYFMCVYVLHVSNCLFSSLLHVRYIFSELFQFPIVFSRYRSRPVRLFNVRLEINDRFFLLGYCGKKLNFLFVFFKLQVEVGDVILKVNETDVKRFSTKEGKHTHNCTLNKF